jgi:hypothetical protein
MKKFNVNDILIITIKARSEYVTGRVYKIVDNCRFGDTLYFLRPINGYFIGQIIISNLYPYSANYTFKDLEIEVYGAPIEEEKKKEIIQTRLL